MIVPDIIKDKWKPQPTTVELLKVDLQTTRTQLGGDLQTIQTQLEGDLQTIQTQLEGDLQTIKTQLNTHTHPLEEHAHQDLVDQLTTEKARTYELQKKVELLEMSHASLIQRIEALENL